MTYEYEDIVEHVGNYYGCSRDEETNQYDTDSYDFQAGCSTGSGWLNLEAIVNCINNFCENIPTEITTTKIINAIGDYFNCSKDDETGKYDLESYDFQAGCYIQSGGWLNLESAYECMKNYIENYAYVEEDD